MPAYAHGFLTAVVLSPDEPDNYPWLQTLLGAATESMPPDTLQQLAREACAEMDAPLQAGNFAPLIKDAADCTRWCQGFLAMVSLANDAWREFNETYIDAGKAMLFMNLIADPKLFADLKISPLSHAQFVRECTPDVASAVRKIAAIVSADAAMLDMFETEDLPEPWCEEDLRALSDEALMEELIALEDRVPRVMIDECIRRGAAFVPRLRAHVNRDQVWPESGSDGEWWAILHTVHILGAVPGREAAHTLLEVMQRMQDHPADHLWDWVGAWPVFFQNKREHAHAGLEAIFSNSHNDPLLRYSALECLVEAAHAAGAETLEPLLDRIARIVEDQEGQELLREFAGYLLLDFPRTRHRPVLERAAQERAHRPGAAIPFTLDGINRAFTRASDNPCWDYHQNYLRFYNPAEIIGRQQRWREEDARDGEGDDVIDYQDEYDWITAEPYVRPEPKIGRNDPCPCGSGKKYKKCCMNSEAASDNLFEA
ncbi:MAG: UPF0149 family protein [Pseudomonadota bacterium]